MTSDTSRLVVFAHGMESGPWGTKITRLAKVARDCGYAVDSPDYSSTYDARERVAMLRDRAPRAQRLVLVGSSMGGYVSAQACAALRPAGLLLMAPAVYYPGYDEDATHIPALTSVIHGWRDDIIDPQAAIRFATTHRSELHLVDDDHRLVNSLDLIADLLARLLARVDASPVTAH